ncbi:hypothetical protein O6H91_02G049300 [Diphasiastrum complanatum]|uniref:Uncharacterized protein n=2 Tax=Diphasiastrum complanatum TaxID=34168 RepID=A0ACC2BXN0_DIPCM|nr:hypothetical protein O6H91_13G096500 [Diphasiastrum complanatum]KAJ7565132.1 hypothetical protein O6H91_02G049300 [Diphasiastrum complanatum]
MALAQVLRRVSAPAGRSALRYMGTPCKRLISGAAGGAGVSWGKRSLLFDCSSRSGQPMVRSMSSASSDSGLLRVLKSEIEHEAEQEKSQEVDKPPKPFTLQDKPGTQEIILRRSYGSEDIAITCVLQTDPYANPAEEEGAEEGDDEQQFSPESVHMNVSISKGGDKPVLEIGCVTTGDDVTIDKVAYVENGSDKELIYDGPEFVELDEELQKQFQRFLEARGINEDLCDFLMKFMPEKERQEYVRWLKNVEAFVKL